MTRSAHKLYSGIRARCASSSCHGRSRLESKKKGRRKPSDVLKMLHLLRAISNWRGLEEQPYECEVVLRQDQACQPDTSNAFVVMFRHSCHHQAPGATPGRHNHKCPRKVEKPLNIFYTQRTPILIKLTVFQRFWGGHKVANKFYI